MSVTQRARSRRSVRARSRGNLGEKNWVGYLYVAPAFLVIAAFLLYPLADTIRISAFDWDGLSPATWVGLGNYRRVFTDPLLRLSFGHALILIIFFAVIPIVAGLLLAGLLQRGAKLPGVGFFRTVLFLPQVISPVVLGIIWVAIYAPGGVLDRLLSVFSSTVSQTAWLGGFDTALIAVGLIGTWIEIGLCMVLFLAGTAQVSPELYEAARVDGAGPVAEFLGITLPALRPQIVVALTLTVIAALRTFDLVYVTTRGGPGTATTVPAFQIYNLAFNQGRIGQASAIGVVLMVLLMLVTVLINRLNPGEDQ